MTKKCKSCKSKKCNNECINSIIITLDNALNDQHLSNVIFKADTSRCRIGLDQNDVEAINRGQVDFVVAFDGYDFTCCKQKDGLLFTPLLGKSFSKTNPYSLGPTSNGYPFDHVKFLAYSRIEQLPTDGTSICFNWLISGEQLNVECNPYDGAVSNPYSDPRLACFGAVSISQETFSTFDWIGTNEIIYALVERLPGLESVYGLYAAYTYLFPVVKRNKDIDPLNDFHYLQTCYNRSEGSVTYIADGIPRLKVTQPGFYRSETNTFIFENGSWVPVNNPQRFMVLNHGGNNPSTPLDIPTARGGLSLFTLEDAYTIESLAPKLDEGLVRLGNSVFRRAPDGSQTFFYNNPRSLAQVQANFFYDCQPSIDPVTGDQIISACIPPAARIFRQGARSKLRDFFVTSGR